MKSIPLSQAHFLPWLEEHLDTRMVPQASAPVEKMSTQELLALRKMLVKYSEDQPRDDHGRWTSDGGGSSDSSPWEIHPESRAAYKQGDHYTPAREAEHKAILDGIFAGHAPAAVPTVEMLGGGPASGKSSGIRAGLVNLPPDAVSINADEIKKQLSDFEKMNEAGRTDASSWVHEEGSDLSKAALKQAAAGGYNVVYDSTGDNSLSNLEGKIQSYRDAGYVVNADYFTVPVDTAVDRAYARANNPGSSDYGRFVPEPVIRQTYASISSVVPAAVDARLWDNFNLWNNDVPQGSAPSLVASYANRGAFTVADQAAYDKFLAAAKPSP